MHVRPQIANLDVGGDEGDVVGMAVLAPAEQLREAKARHDHHVVAPDHRLRQLPVVHAGKGLGGRAHREL